MKFRKKPVVVEAYQTDKEMTIHTLEGDHHASVGDWIITGAKGEQYPCKPDIFEQTYEPVEEQVYYIYKYYREGAELKELPVTEFYNSKDEAIEEWRKAIDCTVNSGYFIQNIRIDYSRYSFSCYISQLCETKYIEIASKTLKS